MSRPLVLLHAFGAAGRSWGPLATALRPQIRVLAPDLPGFGDEAPLQHPSVDAYADWVESFVGREGLQEATLGGWSMGGKIALALAARRPAWLSALVLISPSPPEPEPMDEADREAQLAGHGDVALARRSVEALLGAAAPASRLEPAIADRLRASRSAWRWWLEHGSRERLNIAPPSVSTLLVVGDADHNLGPGAQRRCTAPHLVDPRWVLLHCGHLAPLEAPDDLSAELIPMLRQADPSC